ncbi:MAG: FAD-dependent oxidoreductase, partial [Planctomycetota bacterium]
VVVGGGPGGIGAAVMAALEGARTLLIERYGCLGGMASVGEVHPFMPNHVGEQCLDGPVYLEWRDRINSYYPPQGERPGGGHDGRGDRAQRMISKEAAMLAAEDLCLDAGVEILYHHQLADVIRDGDRIDALVLHSKSGLTAVRGKTFIDATGDADLAARAGCEYEQGGPSGHSQPMTLCFKLSHIDTDRMPDRKEITRRYDEAKAAGEVDCPREDVLMFDWMDADVMHFNTTRVIHRSATSGEELSDAEIQARKQVRQLLKFLREKVPGFENCQIHSMAHHIGIRESRRVKGLNYITRDDYVACAKFDDGIAKVRYFLDIHNPDGTGTERLSLPEGEWYEIPFGCIVAKDATNLLIGGRPISVDHGVHSSMRVMPPACTVGQAAGLGASLAAKDDSNAHALDGTQIRQMLAERGANL